MKTGYFVLDAMTKRPITATKFDSIREACLLMKNHNVGTIIIKDGEELVGILSENDVCRRAVVESLDLEGPIGDIMTPANKIYYATPNMDLFDAIELIREANLKHLPVLDEEDNKLLGYLTMKDILKIQPTLFELLVDRIEIREENEKPIYE